MLRHLSRGAFAAFLALALAIVVSPPAAAQQVDTGSADFTRYVAVGDSLTAGVSSGSLVETVQRTSYPALLYRQVRGTTSGFEQPLVSEPGIPAGIVLRSLSPLTFVVKPGSGQPVNLAVPRPYNNLGIPGANVGDLVTPTSGGAFDLVLRSPALGATVLAQARALNPTFVTVWIGNNDVLAAATSGRVIEGVTITPVAAFQAAFQQLLDGLRQSGAKLAIANIPDVTAIPFVTTLPRFVVNPANNQPVLINGQPVPLLGPNGPLGPGDHVLLTAAAELRMGRGIPAALGGSGLPLSDGAVLDAQESATISARVNAYNEIIRTSASAAGAALVDIHEQLNQLASRGITVGGIAFGSAFLTGGIFSYDGVHPTTFGYAYIANLFIDAINDTFDAEIPPVDLFPFIFGPSEVIAVPGTGVAAEAPLLSREAVRNLFWTLGLSDPAAVPAAPRHGRRGKPGRGGRR